MKKERSLGVYIALGAGIGSALGVALGNIAIGVGVGVAIGLAIGSIKMRNKKDEPDDPE